MWNAGPSPGRTASPPDAVTSPPYRVSRPLQPRAASGKPDRLVDRARRQAEQHARRRSRGAMRPPRRRPRRTGCRRGRARAEPRRSAISSPVALEQGRVPRLGPLPRHRPPRVLAPRALETDLVAGEHHRHARQRHLQPDPDELPVAGAGHAREPGAVVAVERASTSAAIDRHGRSGRNARIVATAAGPSTVAIPTG